MATQWRLGEFSSKDLFPLATRAEGVYELETSIQGNSLLSTVFVASADPGAFVRVSYWDATTGANEGEVFALNEHPDLSSGSHRLTVTRIHDKPRVKVEVIGGNVRFGVYITVVSSFATDLDAALQYEGDVIDVDRDKGIPITAYETTTDEWSFLRTNNGRLQIDVPGVLQVTQQTINFRRYNETLALAPATPTIHVDFTVPAGKRLFWSAGSGSADGWVKWNVDVDGVRWITKRNAFDAPDVQLSLGAPTILVAGQRIIITVENIGDFGNPCSVETFLFGALEDV
jgi:hypothetical protein